MLWFEPHFHFQFSFLLTCTLGSSRCLLNRLGPWLQHCYQQLPKLVRAVVKPPIWVRLADVQSLTLGWWKKSRQWGEGFPALKLGPKGASSTRVRVPGQSVEPVSVFWLVSDVELLRDFVVARWAWAGLGLCEGGINSPTWITPIQHWTSRFLSVGEASDFLSLVIWIF